MAMALRPPLTCSSIHSRWDSQADRTCLGILASKAGGQVGAFWNFSFLGRRQTARTNIFSDSSSINSRLTANLMLAYVLVQQCVDGDLKIRLQNVHPSPLLFVIEINRSVHVLSPFAAKISIPGIRLILAAWSHGGRQQSEKVWLPRQIHRLVVGAVEVRTVSVFEDKSHGISELAL